MMGQSLLEKLLRRPVAMSMAYGSLLVGGVYAMFHLPVDLAPRVEYPSLTVRCAWLSTSPETVEMFLTAPIEEVASTVRGVRAVRSTSSEGKSSVQVEFEQDINVDFARLELNEKLASLAERRPPGAGIPSVEQYVTADREQTRHFLSFSLAGGDSSPLLRQYAEESIAPRLMSVKGVARVEVMGGVERELRIELDPLRLPSAGLDDESVSRALESMDFAAPLGIVRCQGEHPIVSIRNPVIGLREIGHLIVGYTAGGTPIRLQDVASVKGCIAEPVSLSRINGRQAVSIVVYKEAKCNAPRLAEEIFHRVDELSTRLPPDMSLIRESDPGKEMRKELDVFEWETASAVGGITLVLLLFIGHVRPSLTLFSVILLSIAGTLMVFWTVGLALHLVSLGGMILGFGRLIDDSIVVMECVRRHTPMGCDRKAIITGVREVAGPVTASTTATVGALIPLMFLPPGLALYLRDFAVAVCISLLMSLLFSLSLIPIAMSRSGFDWTRPALVGRWEKRLSERYGMILRGVLRHRTLTLCLTMLAFGLPVWLLPEKISSDRPIAAVYNRVIGRGILAFTRPALDYILGGSMHLFFTKVSREKVLASRRDTYLTVAIRFPQGTEMRRCEELCSAVELQVRCDTTGVRKTSTSATPDLAVVIIDFEEWAARTVIPNRMKNRLTMYAAHIGGVTVAVSGFGPGFVFGGQSPPRFSVRVLGYDYRRVKDIAEEFRKRMERNPRIDDVDIDRSAGYWQSSGECAVVFDRHALALEGMSVPQAVRSIRLRAEGPLARSSLQVLGVQVPYVVRYRGHESFSLRDLTEALTLNKAGVRVPLGSFVRTEDRHTPARILRENQQYVRWISFEYKGPYEKGEECIDAVVRTLPLPAGYRCERLMEPLELSQEDYRQLVWLGGIGLLLVYMVTASFYESLVKPFIVIVSVPCAYIGIFVVYAWTATPFGRGGYASAIFLSGIAVTNAMVLVDVIGKHLKSDGTSVRVLIEAAVSRLPAVLLTSLSTIGGVLPIMCMGNRDSVWPIMAMGVAAGLFSSTLLTLVVTPVLYAVFSPVYEP